MPGAKTIYKEIYENKSKFFYIWLIIPKSSK